jgi:hypothetical protein
VNPGGEPERDDTGLPPVDIEIPDDARELDRDVQSYYRELRAQRRQQRGFRVRGSLTKDGIVLPLLACCLILALITGTLLTVFSATSDPGLSGLPGGNATARPPAASGNPSGRASAGTANPSAPASGGTASGGTASSGTGSGAAAPAHPQPATVPGLLPNATIVVGGQAAAPVRGLSQAALVLIPPNCNCTATVSWLIHVATGAHAQPYLVYTASSQAEAGHVYGSLSSSDRAQVLLALERDDALWDSIPDTLQSTGLTLILVGPSKRVTYATGLSPKDDATTLIEALTH